MTTAAVPLMPAKALSGAMGATQVPDLYAKAAQWAGLWEHSSVPMLKYQFGLDDAGARGLFDRLVANQVVGKPDVRGMSKVIVKTYHSPFVASKMQEFVAQKSAPTPAQTPVETAQTSAPREGLNAPKAEPKKIDLKSKILDDDAEVEPEEVPEDAALDTVETAEI